MARRAGSRRGSRRVHGLSDALAAKAHAFAERWSTADNRAELLERAEAFERGAPGLLVEGSTVWSALFAAGSPHEQLVSPRDAGVYEITGRDEIRPIEDD